MQTINETLAIKRKKKEKMKKEKIEKKKNKEKTEKEISRYIEKCRGIAKEKAKVFSRYFCPDHQTLRCRFGELF